MQAVARKLDPGRAAEIADNPATALTEFIVERQRAGAPSPVGGADLRGTAIERHPGDVAAAPRRWEAEPRPEAERKQKLGRRVKGPYAPSDSVRLWPRDLPLRFASYRPVSALRQRRLRLRA